MSKDITPILIHVVGDSPEICKSFLKISSDFDNPLGGINWNGVPSYVKKFFALEVMWRCSDIFVAGLPMHLEYLIQRLDMTHSSFESVRDSNETHIGVICIFDPQCIESVKHCIDAIRYIQTDMNVPYIIARKQSNNYQQKSWHNKLESLNDESLFTYKPESKESIKQVWFEMIRRLELDTDLEARCIDCIKSKT